MGESVFVQVVFIGSFVQYRRSPTVYVFISMLYFLQYYYAETLCWQGFYENLKVN